MIQAAELREKSKELEVGPINIQRDYIFGWLLFGIYAGSDLKDILILKGGNCLRKAFFENTRFSNDLDFSTERAIDPDFLKAELNRACQIAQEASGVVFHLDESRVEEGWSPGKEQRVYKARLYFEDFLGNREGILISVRLDITEFDRIYLPTASRNLIHAYSDADGCRVSMRCLSIEEALASKLKCLLQRKHIADLYDLAYSIFVNNDLAVDRGQIASVFLKKTIFEPSPRAAVSILTGLPLERLESAWNRWIIAPRQSILDFAATLAQFKAFIGELFAHLPSRTSEMAFFPPALRNPIMEAGTSQTILRVTYNNVERDVEPYSLVFKRRKDGVGQEYLYVYDRTGGVSGVQTIKTFVASGFSAIANTEEKFEPREEIIISKAGEPGEELYFGKQSPTYARSKPRPKKAPAFKRPTWHYSVQCLVCQRTFPRTTRSVVLREHKDSYGNRCYGRRGVIVDREFR